MKFSKIVAGILCLAMLTGCGSGTGTTSQEQTTQDAAKNKEVTILYTNDIHTYINNTVTDEEENEERGLSYASVAAMKKDMEEEGKQVLLVDAGDHAQGTAFGGTDEGKSIIKIMNAAGYQLATLGNHEFDYGMFRTFGMMEEANFPYVSCNFYSVEENSLVLPAYEILEAGGVKIAFIGISTPDSLTKASPAYFMDEKEEKYLYNIYGGSDGKELYEAVQKTIDEVEEKADYIVALGHLGVDPSSMPCTSKEVIENTKGLDAFIDGHSHTVLEGEEIKDASGESVLLTQTGNYFQSIGVMTISEEGINTKLVTEYENRDEEVASLEDGWISEVSDQLGEQIAVSDAALTINEAENTDQRAVRKQETNLGDLTADSFYYYFNEVLGMDCDLAIQNGGGIRDKIDEGEVTYMTAKTVFPFGNVACLVEITGQQLLDALEKGAMYTGLMDEETGTPAENGCFMQVAGMRYTIDTSIESTVQLSEEDVWLSGPSGDYKVQNVEIYDKSSGTYKPLELERTYHVAGINYVLRNQGDGLAMLKDSKLVLDYVEEDYMVLADYMSAFTKGEDGFAHISTKNSPLASYKGYQLDYENPEGAGRITIQ